MLSRLSHSRKLIRMMIAFLCLGIVFVACGPGVSTYAPVTEPPAPLPTAEPAFSNLVAVQALQASSGGQHFETYPVYQDLTMLPTTYQVLRYPDMIQNELNNGQAYVVQLPDAKTQEHLQAAIMDKNVQLNNTALNIGLYAFNRTAISEKLDYVAVPVENVPDLNFIDGLEAGVLYDNLGFYGYGEKIYHVWVFDNRIELRDEQGNGYFKAYDGETIDGWVYYSMKYLDQPVDAPVVVFLKNGCWCCWSIFNLNGCLICTRN